MRFNRIFNRIALLFQDEANRLIRIPYGKHSYGPQPKIVGVMPNALYASKGSRIGKYCSIANGVKFSFYGKHDYNLVTTYAFVAFYDKWKQNHGLYKNGTADVSKISPSPIIIENDVWIASDVTIKKGVRVGSGAVIAMESLVTKDVPPYAIVGGNPAKIMKYRFNQKQIKELLEIAWWDWDDATVKKFLPLLLSNNINLFIEKAKQHNQKRKVTELEVNEEAIILDAVTENSGTIPV